MKAMVFSWNEMAEVTEPTRVKVALTINIPAAADADICIHDKVVVYRERPVNMWVGTFVVNSVEGKIVHVSVNGKSTQVKIDAVRVY